MRVIRLRVELLQPDCAGASLLPKELTADRVPRENKEDRDGMPAPPCTAPAWLSMTHSRREEADHI